MKKTMCVFLAVLMCFTLWIPALAVDDEREVVNTRVFEAIALDVNNDNSPLSDYNVEALKIGTPIQTYVFNDGLISKSSATYIPVFAGNEMLAVALVSTNNDAVSVEITTELVQELIPYVNDEICLIFDETDTFLCTEGTVSHLKSYRELFMPGFQSGAMQAAARSQNERINEIQSACVSTILHEGQLSPVHRVENTSAYFAPSEVGRSYPVSYNIGATIVRQLGEPVCWAAVVASIGLELKNIEKTAETVARAYLGDNNWRDGGTPADALMALQEQYDIDGVDRYMAPDFELIKDETYRLGNPVYIRVRGGLSGFSYALDHALFIDGYTDYASGSYIGCLFLGDPNYATYRTVYFASDGNYPYTLNGVTGYVDAYIKLY